MDGPGRSTRRGSRSRPARSTRALVYGFGKSSLGDLPEILTLQLDPYYLAPLWPSTRSSLAALQARRVPRGERRDRARSRRGRGAQPARRARRTRTRSVRGDVERRRRCSAGPYASSPLRDARLPADHRRRAPRSCSRPATSREKCCERPAWIRGIEHRIEAHTLGVARPRRRSPSTTLAGEKAGVGDGTIDVAELHAQFSHQELILREALGLGDDVEREPVGRRARREPVMAAGLIRIGEARRRIIDRRRASRGVAHATSGPCLQQNLVCVLEGRLMAASAAPSSASARPSTTPRARTCRSPGLVREAADRRARRRGRDLGATSTRS